jgi:hypothetical protein
MRYLFFLHRCAFLLSAHLAAAEAKPETYWSEYLTAMKEPSLSSTKVADGDFQFRWSRLDGSHDPMTIRMWREHGKTRCRCVRLKYRADFTVGPIRIDRTILLKDEQSEAVRGYLSREDFWRPFTQAEAAAQRDFLGGSRWLLEKADSYGYHFLSMFSPALLGTYEQRSASPKQNIRSGDAYIALATFLLQTTKIFPDETAATY